MAPASDLDCLADAPAVPDDFARLSLRTPPGADPSLVPADQLAGCSRVRVGYISVQNDTVQMLQLEIETLEQVGGTVSEIIGSNPQRSAHGYVVTRNLVWQLEHTGGRQPIGTTAFLDLPVE